MTNDPYGEYGPTSRYQHDQYPPPPSPEHPPSGREQDGRYPQARPGEDDPTARVVPPPGRTVYGGAGNDTATYGSPAYANPEYANPYGTAEYGTAEYGTAEYGGRQHGNPGYGNPGYGSASYDSPGYGNTQYGTPGSAGPGGPAAPAPAWGAPPPPSPKRRKGLVIGLVAGGLALVLCLGGLGVVAVNLVADKAEPGGGPPGTSGGPFAGTPAAGFAEGAEGIVLPDAEAVGDFAVDEVAGALDQVEQALVAARLDRTMVVDRDPGPFLDLVAPNDRPFLQDEFDEAKFGIFATQIADGTELTPDTPRVDGEVTFEATTDEDGIRVIEIVTSFVWAYAFVVPEDQGLDGVVVVRDELVWQVPHRDDVPEESLGLWLWEGESYAWGIDCEPFEQGLLAPQTEPQFGLGGPEDDQVFDPDGSLDFQDTC